MFNYDVKVAMIKKEVIREYDKDGKVVRERTILHDGGLGQEEAEKVMEKAEERMKGAEEKTEKANKRMNGMFKKMEEMFSDMDKLFKDLF